MRSLPENIDFSVLASSLEQPTLVKKASRERIRYADNKATFTKVGFDLFREDNSNSLWQLTRDEGGAEWLVRSDISDPVQGQSIEGSQKTAWRAIPHKDGRFVTLAYKRTPVTLFSGEQFQFSPHEVGAFCDHLMKKVASQDFTNRLLKVLPQHRTASLRTQHPELFVK